MTNLRRPTSSRSRVLFLINVFLYNNNNNNIIIIIIANKIAKYTELNTMHHFTPIAIETGGAWNHLAIEVVSELGKR